MKMTDIGQVVDGVMVESGTYAVEWFGVDGRETAKAGDVTIESSTPTSFSAPLEAGPAVLYVKKIGD
jgi:hypothetical protein